MRFALALLSAGVFAALAGYQREPPSLAIGKEVVIDELDAGRNAARFEASVVANGKVNGLDYATALLTAAGRACSPLTLTLQDQSSELGNADSTPEAGTTLAMTVACRHDRIPGHRVATEAEAGEIGGAVSPGSSNKTAYKSMRADETRVQSADALIGGFVREAYTEECDGQGLVVEKIEMASVPLQAGTDAPFVENLHAVMHFRCIDSLSGQEQVAKTAPQ